jgi:hypothetical protein
MSNTVRIIESIMPAEDGYFAVVALQTPKMYEYEKGWWIFKKKYQYEESYVKIPVLFWATMFLHNTDSDGNETRTNSVMIPMVRMNDSVDAAPTLDGYIAVMTPYDEDVESIPGMMDAIEGWRKAKFAETKQKATSLN